MPLLKLLVRNNQKRYDKILNSEIGFNFQRGYLFRYPQNISKRQDFKFSYIKHCFFKFIFLLIVTKLNTFCSRIKADASHNYKQNSEYIFSICAIIMKQNMRLNSVACTLFEETFLHVETHLFYTWYIFL